MTKLLSMIVAAMFAAVSVNAIAASHAGAKGDKMDKMEKKGDKMAKKPSAEECKKDPKMKGCEPAKKMDKMEKKGDKK